MSWLCLMIALFFKYLSIASGKTLHNVSGTEVRHRGLYFFGSSLTIILWIALTLAAHSQQGTPQTPKNFGRWSRHVIKILESLRLDKTIKIIKFNFKKSPAFQLNHSIKFRIQSSFEHFQGWWSHCIHSHPVSMPDIPFSEEILPAFQPELLLAQLETLSSPPITGSLREGTNTHLATTSFQVVVENV